jgi:hypothetical protein
MALRLVFLLYVITLIPGRLNWQDIAALQKDGMDIESHSMTHTPYLNLLNQKQEQAVGCCNKKIMKLVVQKNVLLIRDTILQSLLIHTIWGQTIQQS